MMRAFCLVSFTLVVGCGSSSDGARPAPPEPEPMLPERVPLPECPDASYEPCDIREVSCQDQLIQLTCCLRQAEPVPDIRIEVMTPDEYSDVLREDWADYPEAATHYERALSVLGLGPEEGVSKEDGIAGQVKFLYGVYRSQERRIIVIDHGLPEDSADENALLVHEYVHVLQDADYDFSTWPQGIDTSTFDSYLATDAVLEGEATYYQNRAGAPLLGLDVNEVSFNAALLERMYQRFGYALGSTTPIGSSYSSFPYGPGAYLVYQAWQRGGLEGVDELWAAPPVTTHQILAPIFDRRVTPSVGITFEEPTFDGLVLDHGDSLGAWGLGLFHYKANPDIEDLIAVMLPWRGDHLWIYTDATGEPTYGLWLVELGNEAEATRLDTAFASGLRVEHGTAGNRAYASFAFRGAVPIALTDYAEAWLRGD